MSSQKKQPLPNPFDTAVNTGKIGGQGKQEKPEADNTVKQQPPNTAEQQTNNTVPSKTSKEEKIQSVNTNNQQTLKTAKRKSIPAEEKQPHNKVQTPPPAPEKEEPETHEEDKTKLTCLIPTDLFIRLKIYTARRKKAKETMTNITIKALEEYLTNHP
jgi:hypothetical protein